MHTDVNYTVAKLLYYASFVNIIVYNEVVGCASLDIIHVKSASIALT